MTCLHVQKGSNHTPKVNFFLLQVSVTLIVNRLDQLKRRRVTDESSQRQRNLQVMIEKCNEQYKAIEITTEWIEVCVVHRFMSDSRCLLHFFILFSLTLIRPMSANMNEGLLSFCPVFLSFLFVVICLKPNR